MGRSPDPKQSVAGGRPQLLASFAQNGVLAMPRRQSQTTLQLQQLIDSTRLLTEAVHTYAQSNQQLAAAVAQLVEMVAEDVVGDDDAPPATYLNGRPIV